MAGPPIYPPIKKVTEF